MHTHTHTHIEWWGEGGTHLGVTSVTHTCEAQITRSRLMSSVTLLGVFF